MAATLYPTLLRAIETLARNTATSRESFFSQSGLPSSFPPLPRQHLYDQIKALWEECSSNSDSPSSSSGISIEATRSLMDLIGRDLVINVIVQEELEEPSDNASAEQRCRFQTNLQDRLDIVLTLYEIVCSSHQDSPSLEPGAIFIPLLEELVELISVESWHDLWSYVETRSKRFTKNMPASKGKALPLLRTINSFLRFLPRTPADLVFRGRVHQFASSVISVADKSAINMRGDYSDVRTTWEEVVVPVSTENKVEEGAQKEDEGGDVQMKSEAMDDKMGNEETEKPQIDKQPESHFYTTLWSLQQYFASPPTLDGPATRSNPSDPLKTPFELFKEKSDYVLPILFAQTVKEKELMGKDVTGVGKKRKRNAENVNREGGFFHPRYLTGKRLLEHELADPSFRRQILVQYFILFQFLLNLTPASASKQAFTGGMPKTFVINSEDETWVKQKVAGIREELRKMIPDGPRFEETVLSIITRERHYAQWKNDGCPETVFEIPPLSPESAKAAAELWKRRLSPPSSYPFKVGSRPLSKLWNHGFTSMDQLKGWKRSVTVVNLDEEVGKIEMDEEDDRAMGHEPSAEFLATNAEKKINLTWRAIRLSTQTDLRHFHSLAAKRDLHVLTKSIKESESLKSVNSVTSAVAATTAVLATTPVTGDFGVVDVAGSVEEVVSVVKDEVPDQGGMGSEVVEGDAVKEDVEMTST